MEGQVLSWVWRDSGKKTAKALTFSKGIDIIAILGGFIAELYHPGPSQTREAMGGPY